jgi:hypothetical protein
MGEEEDDDVLEVFMFENSVEDGMTGKFKCSFCKNNKKHTFKNLKNHFADNHKTEFENFFGTDGNILI